MAVEWFCQVMGAEVGPLTQGQLVDMVRQHQVNPEDLVRRGNSSWVAAFEVKGLFEAAAKPTTTNSARQPKDNAAQAPAAASPNARVAPTTKPSADAPPKVASAPNGDGGQIAEPESHNATAHEVATSANDWFCIASGEKLGPLRFDELQKLADDGSLRGKDRVWRGSWPKFRRASEVEELSIES